MQVSLWVNHDKDTGLEISAKLVKALESYGATVRMDMLCASVLGRPELGTAPNELTINSQVLLVLGGDGTILRAVKSAAPYSIPILGINLGRIGFLSGAEVDNLYEVARRIVQHDFILERRMMLKAKVIGAAQTSEYLALNDVVLSRGGLSRMIGVRINVDGQLVDHYMSDGVVVASPTGSTAYALSAGGPILDPTLDCMLLAPICAHTLYSRPIVIAANSRIELVLTATNRDAQLSLDGETLLTVSNKLRIEVLRAQEEATFIRFREKNFYQLLHSKFSEWSMDEQMGAENDKGGHL